MSNDGMRTTSEHGSTLRCTDCTIFIGQGHQETSSHQLEHESGSLCGMCHKTRARQAARGPLVPATPSEHPTRVSAASLVRFSTS